MRRLIPHLAAAFVVGACIWLTLWQIDRADDKRQLLSDWHSRAQVPVDVLQAPYDLPQPVVGVGKWLPGRQLLLDNQVRDGRQGVFVLTPWQSVSGRVFLVNRGWASWPSRSAPLPDPRLGPETPERISGVLNTGPAVGARLGSLELPAEPTWPLLVTYFDADALTGIYGSALQPAVIQLEPTHPAHLTGTNWRVVTFGPERHLGYALTWTTIGLVVLGIWLALSLGLGKRKDERSGN